MPDAVNLTGAIQKVVSKTLKAAKLSDISYGTVTSTNPLKIMTDQKVELYERMLVLTRNVTDYEVDIETSWQTEEKSGGSGDDSFASHRHEIRGRKKMKVYNALQTGDRVLLVRMQNTQQRIVLDRIQPAVKLEGEWAL